MYFLLNLSHYVKRYGHFCQILVFFMMPAHKILSCHVTEAAKFENVLFCPNSTFNRRKSHKISSGKLSTSEAISQKSHRGGGVFPPVPLELSALSFRKELQLINCQDLTQDTLFI